MKRLLTVAVAISLAVLSGLAPTTAAAGNPSEVEVSDFILLFPDTNEGVSVFINISAREFCDWIAAPSGPPPAREVVTAQLKETGQGALVGRLRATDLYIEMWRFDEDPSPLIGPCEDIAKQLADPDAEPFAVGTATYHANDNDFAVSGTRGNAFGDRGSAALTGQDGTEYAYTWRFHINDRCHVDAGPPACLVESSSLRST